MKLVESFKENKTLLVLPGFLLFILIVIAIVSSSNNNSSGAEKVSPDSSAFLIYKNNNYSATNINASDSLLQDDIAFFARKNFNAYDPKKQPSVTFNIAGRPKQNGDTTSFTGSYQKVKNRIQVTVTKLKNRRIKSSIKDTKTGANIDSLLPSNNKTNLFILSLPITTPTYSIFYSLETNKVTINLNSYSPSDKQVALTRIAAAVGADYITSGNINVYYASSPPGITEHVDYIRDSVISL